MGWGGGKDWGYPWHEAALAPLFAMAGGDIPSSPIPFYPVLLTLAQPCSTLGLRRGQVEVGLAATVVSGLEAALPPASPSPVSPAGASPEGPRDGRQQPWPWP